jgi:hypothetical protein
MGIELELAVLLAVAILGQSTFAVFEVEKPAWRKVLKWALICVLTLLLYRAAGHWALLFPAVALVAATTFHFVWCARHGIHPLRATPRRRYYELRGWVWPDHDGVTPPR